MFTFDHIMTELNLCIESVNIGLFHAKLLNRPFFISKVNFSKELQFLPFNIEIVGELTNFEQLLQKLYDWQLSIINMTESFNLSYFNVKLHIHRLSLKIEMI